MINPLAFSVSLVVALLAVTGCGSSSGRPAVAAPGYKTVTFSNGTVQFAIPETYTQRSEPDDTLAITPGDNAGVVLRFTLHTLPDAVAEEFLESQAQKKGLQIERIGNKATISESGTRSEGGREYDMAYWQVGFGDSMVVMSTETDRKRKAEQIVSQCLNEVPKIIESMQKY
jgi:hypothetical protein